MNLFESKQNRATIPEGETSMEKLKAENIVLKEQIAYLEKQLGIDFLTSASNRRTFENKLDQSLVMIREGTQEQRAGTEPLKEISLIFIDIDNFKQVNDTLGHLAGDAVLKKVTELLRSTLRETDMLSRYGGDEFTVLLSNTKEEHALMIAEKLRMKIESAAELKKLKVTASFGVCSSEKSTDMETLHEYVDRALYAAKHNGRNRVEVYKGNET